MKLAEIRDLLDCEVLTGAHLLDTEVDAAVASEAMSAVLAHPHPRAFLITGLTNVQSVRTALVAFASAILYVGGNRPGEATIRLAEEKQLVLLMTTLGTFETSGILYAHGIKGAS
jgi:predicted transcriptional regulator